MTKAQKVKKTHSINWSTVKYIVFLLLWVAISMTLSQYAIGLPMLWILGDKFSQPLWTCIYYALTYILALVLVLVVPPRAAGWLHKKSQARSKADLANLATSRNELGLKDLPTVVDVGLAPIAYVAYMILSYAFTSAMSVFAWFDAEETQDVGFGYFITTGDRVVAMIALVFIAPIAEEIIMRGWLYGKVRNKLKVVPAVIVVSLLFGAMHGQWNAAIVTFILSCILCSLREVTGTIWSGVLLHMIVNAVAFYVNYTMIGL